MKNRMYLIVLLLISSLIFSCQSDDVNNSNEFQNSDKALSDFKKSTNNSYKYVVTGATWGGPAWETTITVSNGKAIQRHFKYTNIQGLSNIPKEELEWTENGIEIGSHKNAAAPALTLDEIYQKAELEWLIKRDNARIYFETKNNGLISTCGYVIDGCQDDCFVGIHIKSITPLTKKGI